jgi:predicted amidohydrolase
MSGVRGDPEGMVTLAVLSAMVTGGDSVVRRQQLAELVRGAPDADLLILPYLAVQTPFWDRLDRPAAFRQAERSPCPSLLAAQAASRERGIPLLASVYEATGEGIFYALAEVRGRDGELTCTYRQWHALNETGLHERLYFQPGSGAIAPVFDCGGMRLGLLMGGDLWVPEAARLLRLGGAEVILALTALPDALVGQGATIAPARSIENGVPVVLANRGGDPRSFGSAGESGTIREGGAWSLIDFESGSIRQRLRRKDPLWMRRPRIYAPLAGKWEESTP